VPENAGILRKRPIACITSPESGVFVGGMLDDFGRDAADEQACPAQLARFSTSSTRFPLEARCIAAGVPPGPPPMMTTSVFPFIATLLIV